MTEERSDKIYIQRSPERTAQKTVPCVQGIFLLPIYSVTSFKIAFRTFQTRSSAFSIFRKSFSACHPIRTIFLILMELTQGKTIDDSIEMARDYIGLKVMDLQDYNEPIPTSNYSLPQAKESDIVTLVDVDIDSYRRKHDTKLVKKL